MNTCRKHSGAMSNGAAAQAAAILFHPLKNKLEPNAPAVSLMGS
jgi:hypothetical protein